jgi:hypothetical protein
MTRRDQSNRHGQEIPDVQAGAAMTEPKKQPKGNILVLLNLSFMQGPHHVARPIGKDMH